MVRYVQTEQLRGSGQLLVEGRRVASVLYWVDVEEAEEEINGTWQKTGFRRFPSSVAITHLDDRAALDPGAEFVLSLQDGRQLGLLIHRTTMKPDGTLAIDVTATGNLMDPAE